METFLEYETIFRETPPGHVFVGSLFGNRSKESGRSGAGVVHVTKNNASATHFFALSPKPIV